MAKTKRRNDCIGVKRNDFYEYSEILSNYVFGYPTDFLADMLSKDRVNNKEIIFPLNINYIYL